MQAVLRFVLIAAFGLGGLELSLPPTSVFGQEALAPDSKTAAEQAGPPPLSIDTIYGVEDRYDYDGPPAPPHRWVVRDGSSRLAIERDSSWHLLDPASGDEVAWDVPERLTRSISALPQVSEEEAKRAAARLLHTPGRNLDRFVVRIDQGYALAGLETPAKWVTHDGADWHDVTLDPTGTYIAYTSGNDLYVHEVATGSTRRLTSNGSETQLNGILDWSYQEEIYGRGNFKAFWWSPDGTKLAFLRLNIADVYEYTIADSATPRGGILQTRYPKVGDPIPEAELWVADLQGTLWPIHRAGPETDEQLIVRVSWHPDSHRVAYQVTDRVQSWLELRLADVGMGSAGADGASYQYAASSGSSDSSAAQTDYRRLLRDASPAWVEVLGEPIWLNDHDFLWLSDQPSGRRRLWRVNRLGAERLAVTPESFLVRSLGPLSPDQRAIHVYGDAERGTRGQQLYRAIIPEAPARSDDDRPVAERAFQRLTTGEGWHSVDLDPLQQWMVDSFSTVAQPPTVSVKPVPDRDAESTAAKSEPRYVLKEPPELPEEWVEPQWLEVTVGDGIELPGYYLRPTDTGEPVPVLIDTYGGPLAPSAVDRWEGTRSLYRQFLVQQGIAVMVVDNRSSAGRGIADTWSIHRQMGVVELQDLLTFVDWLKDQPWVDSEHLGLRGWSFGGYLTAYAMTHSDAFAAGVAGGSPTDWRNYDAIYTERYMGLPEENVEGYERTSVTAAAEDLHGRLLLIHGELDDNVHAANTLQLAAALQRAGKQFDLMIYPGAAHGVHHPAQVHHMMTMITQFLIRHLDP